MAKLKIGVVGLGGIGNNHARCYTANPHTEIVAVCDIIKDKADKAVPGLKLVCFQQALSRSARTV